jgi:hypothetical protein
VKGGSIQKAVFCKHSFQDISGGLCRFFGAHGTWRYVAVSLDVVQPYISHGTLARECNESESFLPQQCRLHLHFRSEHMDCILPVSATAVFSEQVVYLSFGWHDMACWHYCRPCSWLVVDY